MQRFIPNAPVVSNMLSQNDLAQKWRNGDVEGRASNVRIVDCAGGITLLVAYDHYVMGVRYPSGTTYAYAGWYQEGHNRMSGSVSLKNMFSRMSMWTCDYVCASDMADDRRAIKGDKRASRLANIHDESVTPEVSDFHDIAPPSA